MVRTTACRACGEAKAVPNLMGERIADEAGEGLKRSVNLILPWAAEEVTR